MTVAVVHEQMHQRAGQQEEIGQCTQDMGLMFFLQEEGADSSQHKKRNADTRAPERPRVGEARLRHGAPPYGMSGN